MVLHDVSLEQVIVFSHNLIGVLAFNTLRFVIILFPPLIIFNLQQKRAILIQHSHLIGVNFLQFVPILFDLQSLQMDPPPYIM